jgi:hypothetical protein
MEDGELSKYLGSNKGRLREATGVVSALHDYIEKSRELVKSEATHV